LLSGAAGVDGGAGGLPLSIGAGGGLSGGVNPSQVLPQLGPGGGDGGVGVNPSQVLPQLGPGGGLLSPGAGGVGGVEQSTGGAHGSKGVLSPGAAGGVCTGGVPPPQ
jgi:hypothetical protein